MGIIGDADEPDGLTFTDSRGRPLAPAGTPVPPTGPVPTGNWTHPTGERMDDECVVFSDPPVPVADYPPFVDLDDPVFGVQDEDEAVGFG